jgi:hypothetical protein
MEEQTKPKLEIVPPTPEELGKEQTNPKLEIVHPTPEELDEEEQKPKLDVVHPTPEELDEEEQKPKLDVVHPTPEELDEEEQEFRALRRDLPGMKGSSAAGIVSIGVAKVPGRNEFFRTHPDFRPVIPIVDLEVGMEKQFFAVTDPMVEALAEIGITVSDHVLYFTVTARGAFRIVPVRQAGPDGEQNEYDRTRETGLLAGINDWVRLYTDQENRCYRVFPAPVGRFADPVLPELKQAKIFRLGFRDKGRLIDSRDHALYLKWAARDRD